MGHAFLSSKVSRSPNCLQHDCLLTQQRLFCVGLSISNLHSWRSFTQKFSNWNSTQVHKSTNSNFAKKQYFLSTKFANAHSIIIFTGPTSTSLAPVVTTPGLPICTVERKPCNTIIVFTGDVSVSRISTISGYTSGENNGSCWLPSVFFPHSILSSSF